VGGPTVKNQKKGENKFQGTTTLALGGNYEKAYTIITGLLCIDFEHSCLCGCIRK
jgi:hypothetical protein